MSSNRNRLELMAEWLKRGATMLSELCPDCSSPLFKLRDEIWCPSCNKRVVVIRREEEAVRATAPLLLSAVEETILSKIKDILGSIKSENDIRKLYDLSQVLSAWLDILEKINRVRRAIKV